MEIPREAPEPSKIKLNTMTVEFNLDTMINLRVVSENIELHTEQEIEDLGLKSAIIGVKFEDINNGKTKITKPAKKKTKKRIADFRNQCTLIIHVPVTNDPVIKSKNINVKLFNNGRLIFTGCTQIEQVSAAVELIVERIHRLSGYLEYEIPTEFKNYSTKDIFRKEILNYRELIHILAYKMNIDLNYEAFNPVLKVREALDLFKDICARESEENEVILTLLTIINILRTYYSETEIKTWKSDRDLPILTDMIIGCREEDGYKFNDVFPSYIGNDYKITVDLDKINICNINSKMGCNYALNRHVIVELLDKRKDIVKVELDEDRYPGVQAVYRMPNGNEVSITFFASGKINITSVKNPEDIVIVYNFIKMFCRDNFRSLLNVSEYLNQKKQELDDMPNQFTLGEHDGLIYILLKKNSIIKNPRNVFLLKSFGLLDQYQ